ncbi:MAG: hypothetical protein LBT09_04270 [Planctomycetaceae bacterium]|nr:hypothetical protein [Planctomycetaceae bacterium]
MKRVNEFICLLVIFPFELKSTGFLFEHTSTGAIFRQTDRLPDAVAPCLNSYNNCLL